MNTQSPPISLSTTSLTLVKNALSSAITNNLISFKILQEKLQEYFDEHFSNQDNLFIVDLPPTLLWDTYLESFPENERQDKTCNACCSFIKNYGGLVYINKDTYELVSIWNFYKEDSILGNVFSNLAKLVEQAKIKHIFYTPKDTINKNNIALLGIKSSKQVLIGETKIWSHLSLEYKKIYQGTESIESIQNNHKKERFRKGLEEFSYQTLDEAIELAKENQVYRLNESLNNFIQFRSFKEIYDSLAPTLETKVTRQNNNSRLDTVQVNIENNPINIESNQESNQEKTLNISQINTGNNLQDNYCWFIASQNKASSQIRGTVAGNLLTDIEEGVDFEIIIRKFEDKMDPNKFHQRSKNISSPSQVKKFQEFANAYGYTASLKRRFAKESDIPPEQVLYKFSPKTKQIEEPDIFGQLINDIKTKPKDFSGAKTVSIEEFLESILPSALSVEILNSSKIHSNLVSLTAPQDKDSPSIFKWANSIGWNFNGDITDSSIKENVQKAGGNVTSPFRFSIQWNEEGNNNIDFDAHCTLPNQTEIYFSNKSDAKFKAELDVDIINPKGEIAVENIFFKNLDSLTSGKYKFILHNYSNKTSKGGFKAEIAFKDNTYQYEYNKNLKGNEKIEIATVKIIKNKKRNGQDGGIGETEIKFLSGLTPVNDFYSGTTEIWGLKNNEFHKVTHILKSPNYWGQAIGRLQYFFLVENCKTETAKGFHNEFLIESMKPYRTVLQQIGNKTLVAYDENQLSGFGFSTGKPLPVEFIVKVQDNKYNNRVYRIKVK